MPGVQPWSAAFAASLRQQRLSAPAGLEPATCGLEVRCSIQLSYRGRSPKPSARGRVIRDERYCAITGMETTKMLDVPSLGVRIDIRRATAELLEFDVVGRARGFIAQAHVHPGQSERHEVIEGTMRLKTGGSTRTLRPGDVFVTSAGTAHRHGPADDGEGARPGAAPPAGRRWRGWSGWPSSTARARSPPAGGSSPSPPRGSRSTSPTRARRRAAAARSARSRGRSSWLRGACSPTTSSWTSGMSPRRSSPCSPRSRTGGLPRVVAARLPRGRGRWTGARRAQLDRPLQGTAPL